jgi:hypothetical protein
MQILFLSLMFVMSGFMCASDSKRPNTPVVSRLKEDSKKNPAAVDYDILKKSHERNQKGRSQSNPHVSSTPKRAEAPKS